MKLQDLSSTVIEKIKACRYDQILEKHEGPEDWGRQLEYYNPELMQINGYHVLLPIDQDEHPNITILRCIPGDHEQSLTLFLKNTTYLDRPEDEFFMAGFMAVCDKFPGEDFFLAILYHEWFIIDEHTMKSE